MISPEKMAAALDEIAHAAGELNTGKITRDQYEQIKEKYPFVDLSDIIAHMMDGVAYFGADFASKKTRRKGMRGLLSLFHFPRRMSRRNSHK